MNSRIKQKTDEADTQRRECFLLKISPRGRIDSWRVSINLLSLPRRLIDVSYDAIIWHKLVSVAGTAPRGMERMFYCCLTNLSTWYTERY